uniref:Uncharacterized protein n=1 Tax=Salix viminalis TaxID=40686 RepID=A0A6N2N011_SALVM
MVCRTGRLRILTTSKAATKEMMNFKRKTMNSSKLRFESDMDRAGNDDIDLDELSYEELIHWRVHRHEKRTGNK